MRGAWAISVLLLAGCAAGTPDAEPTAAPTAAPSASPTMTEVELDGVERFEDLSTEHTSDPVEYEQVPPVGGSHLPRWLACDVYDEPVPDEAAVHSLEHGAVWITYRPDLPDGDVARLAALAQVNQEYVLVSPYDGLPAPVVVTAWGAQLRVDGADDPRIRAFVDAFAGGDQGGEPGAPCREGGLTPAEASGAVGT